MATRVIAAQDKAISGAGDDVQIKGGSANTSGAGGSIVLQPGAQATSGGNGAIRFVDPTNSSNYFYISSSSTQLSIGLSGISNDVNTGGINFNSTNIRGIGTTNTASLFAGSFYLSSTVLRSTYGASVQLGSANGTSTDNINYIWMRQDGHIAWYGDVGLRRDNIGVLTATNGSTGGGSIAYTASTPTALSTTPNNDLVLTGSAFQRLSASSAVSLTGIAPPSGGSHVDGRLIWLYNVGSFNITLKHSQTSTAANQFVNEGGGDIVLGPNRVVQAIYDATTTKWRVNGETYPYVFPTTDGTNGQVLTTNGSGTLSWTTVSAGATASGTTNYIAKFTGASTLGNSLLYDDGSNVGIGTTSPLGRLDVVGANTYEPIRAITNSASNLESGANATVGLSVNNSNTTAGNGIAISFATATTNSNLYGVGAVGFNSLTHTTLGVPQGNFQVITRDAGGGLTPKLTINTSGNIGFGTTSPDKRLTIAANGPSPGITIYKSPDGTLNSAQLVAALGTGSSNTNAGTTGGNEYGILQLNHSGTVRCQFYANAGGAAGSNFVLDGVSFGTTATSAGQVYIIPANAASKALVVRGAGSQSANLTDWQNDSGTILARIDNVGKFIESYNSASSLSTFSVGKTVVGGVHFANGSGTNTSTRNEAAITFQGDVATEAQAGIYVTNDNSTGTHMAFATTDSYATGPQLGLTIANTGAVSFPRASTVSTPAVCSIGSNSNDGGVLKLYSAGFGLRITSLNGDIISGDVNSVNITPGAAGNTTGLNVVANMGANGTVAGFTNNGNVGSKVVVIKGKASQTGNLTEWQDSTGAVVASVSPTGAFFGSSYTSYGTVDSATQIFGNNYWVPNYTGGVTSPSAGTYTKSSGSNTAWDGQVYSSEGYIKNVYCSAKASQTTGFVMFGLNSDPSTDGNYTSLDYAWFFDQNGVLTIYESGVLVNSYGTYTTSTVLAITYDGTNIRYWKDGVLQRTVARATGNPLYFDSSFYNLNASINSVQFGPIGQPFGISGTSGYLPKFTSQQTLGNSNVNVDSNAMYVNGQATSDLSGQIMVMGSSDNRQRITMGVNTTSGYGYIQSYLNTIGNYSLALNPQGGNVGVGTASPSNNLSIGAAAGKIGFQRGSGDGEYCTMGFKSTSGNDRYVFEINNNSGTGELRLNQGGTSTPIGMTFYTNNTERMRIDSSGNVGVGVTPSTANYGGTYGLIAAGNGSGYGIFSGQTTATATDSIAAAFAAVTTGASTFKSLGTVGIYVDGTSTTNAAGRIAFAVGDGAGAQPERMRITSAGNVGIGTTSPSFKLQVDAASVDANIVANVTSGYGGIGVYAAGTNKVVLGYAGANANYGSQTIAGDIALKVNNSNFHINTGSGNSVTTAYFSYAGNVGIGNVSPGARLQVDTGATGTKGQIIKGFLGQTANLTEWQNSTGTTLSIVDASGRVGIGYSGSLDAVAGYSYNLRTGGNILLPNTGQIGFLNSTGAGAYATIQYDSNNKLIIGNFNFAGLGINVDGGVERFLLTNTTATFKTLFTVGVEGVSSSNVNFYVKAASGQTANIQEWRNNGGTALAYMDANGNFFAVSKSFLIDHPTPAKAAEGKKLRYASLEGPENGVYFRGRLEGENVIVLPDYWVDLVDPDSITVNLTPRKYAQPSLFVVDANAERVLVESDRQVCCDFIVYGTRKDIAKLEVEIDGN